MASLGNGHDNAVKKWANFYIPDLRSQEESTVPSYIEQSNSFTVVDQGSETESSEEEDDECSDPFSVSSSEYSYSSDSDDDVYCYDENAISVIAQQMPLVPLIARPPQVLEPCHHITFCEAQRVPDCRRQHRQEYTQAPPTIRQKNSIHHYFMHMQLRTALM